MDAITQMYQENLRISGLADAASAAPVEAQPARRTVESTVPVLTVQTVKTVPLPPVDTTKLHQSVEFQLASLTNVVANLQERSFKLEHGAPVPQDRVTELEARIAALENALRPALAEKPVAEIDKIQLEYLSLAGKTELTYHQYRCLARTARQALLAGVA
jgi:hypothetical protein